MLPDDFRREWVARLFGGARYEFGFGMRRGTAENWFRWDGWDAEAIDERKHWLTAQRDWSLAWNDEAAPLLEEALRLFPEGGCPPLPAGTARERAVAFSKCWEPDWLILSRGTDGEFRLCGAAVCFPSSWDVREKLGRTITDVHSIVPTLNASLGDRIRSFLARMPDGAVFERENWGLAATAERNAHPERGLPRLGADATLKKTWLRLEHQAFRSLAGGAGLLFVLRVRVIRLDELLADASDKAHFSRMLETMPAEIAGYKGIEQARESLIASCRL